MSLVARRDGLQVIALRMIVSGPDACPPPRHAARWKADTPRMRGNPSRTVGTIENCRTTGSWLGMGLAALGLLIAVTGTAAAQTVDHAVPEVGIKLDPAGERSLRQLVERMAAGPDDAGSVDSFFASPGAVGTDYVALAGVYAYQTGTAPPDPCELPAAAAAADATYCAVSRTVAYDFDWLRSLYRDVGPTGPAVAIASAWGSYVAASRGTAPGPSTGLQADCYAGMYLRWLTDLGGIAGDSRSAAGRLFAAARPEPAPARPSPWFDETTHGDRLERRVALGVGYEAGDIRLCDAYATSAVPAPIGLGGSVTLRLPHGSDLREIGQGSWSATLPGVDIELATQPAAVGRLPADTMRESLRARFGADVRTGVVSGGFPADPAWRTGPSASIAFAASATADSPAVSGVAALTSDADGPDRMIIVSTSSLDPPDTQGVMRAISWGYCDPRALDPTGCDAAAQTPPSVSSPTAGPGLDPDELRRRRRQAEQELMAGVPLSLADGCRRYRGTGDAADPFIAGATAAITCDVGARHIAEYALFQFLQPSFRDRYYFGRAYLTGLREDQGSCGDGRGEQAWAHGRVACWVSPTAPHLAHIRWTDDRDVTYGILDGSDGDIDALYRWWRHNVEDVLGS